MYLTRKLISFALFICCSVVNAQDICVSAGFRNNGPFSSNVWPPYSTGGFVSLGHKWNKLEVDAEYLAQIFYDSRLRANIYGLSLRYSFFSTNNGFNVGPEIRISSQFGGKVQDRKLNNYISLYSGGSDYIIFHNYALLSNTGLRASLKWKSVVFFISGGATYCTWSYTKPVDDVVKKSLLTFYLDSGIGLHIPYKQMK